MGHVLRDDLSLQNVEPGPRVVELRASNPRGGVEPSRRRPGARAEQGIGPNVVLGGLRNLHIQRGELRVGERLHEPPALKHLPEHRGRSRVGTLGFELRELDLLRPLQPRGGDHRHRRGVHRELERPDDRAVPLRDRPLEPEVAESARLRDEHHQRVARPRDVGVGFREHRPDVDHFRVDLAVSRGEIEDRELVDARPLGDELPPALRRGGIIAESCACAPRGTSRRRALRCES